MTPFEYVIVLISIILGLGITTILTGVAELIKNTSVARLFPPYIIWIILIFLLHFQDWWLSYQLMSIEEWSLHFFLIVVLYPINLYILAHLLFPPALNRDFDSRTFFLEHYPRLFIGAIVLVILSIIQNLTIGDQPAVTQIPHVAVLTLLVLMLWRKSRSGTMHNLVAIGLLILMVAAFVIDQENLVIR